MISSFIAFQRRVESFNWMSNWKGVNAIFWYVGRVIRPVSKVSSHLLDKHIVITCNVIAVYVLQEKVFYLLEYVRLHQLEFFRSAIAKKITRNYKPLVLQ